jgi:hypothetical protein
MTLPLQSVNSVLIRQKREMAELFGFETRNKYSIELENGEVIAFAAEQQKGILGMLLRQVLGHWRRFHFTIFNRDRAAVLTARHPFRFFFQRMELESVSSTGGPMRLGAIQQRFGILYRKVDIEDSRGEVIFAIRSPLWRLWTFTVHRAEATGLTGATPSIECARIQKKWGGILKEVFLDADSFRIEFLDGSLSNEQRLLLLATGLFLDLKYFERKAGN